MEHDVVSIGESVFEQRRLASIIDLAVWRSLRRRHSPELTGLPFNSITAILNDLREDLRVVATHLDHSRIAGSARRGALRPEQLFALVNLGLADEVADSQSLLELEDDWDGEGSPGYREQTWQRAIALLLAIASRLQETPHLRLSAAEIMPGSYGNIDFELRTSDRMLLCSVPPDQESPVRYYGHDVSRRNTTKGMLDLDSSTQWLAGWLAGV